MPSYLHTALISRPIGTSGATCYFKMDAYQPTGSFKIRGMDHLVRTHVNAGKSHFIASSGGNAGLSLAYSARLHHARATVVVPEATPQHMRDMILNEGAELIVEGKEWIFADAKARQLVEEENAVYVSPYDDPLLWEGHASLIDEVVLDMKAQGKSFPAQIVVAVGGGGLLNGLMIGLERNGILGTTIWAAETEGAASYALSLEKGHLATLSKIETVASSLAARQVSDVAFAWSQKTDVRSLVVSDAQAVSACRRFVESHRVVVEPACGAALAGLGAEKDLIPNDKDTLMVVCGGAGWQLSHLQNCPL